MKKMLSMLLSASMIISAVPVIASGTNEDSYFTDVRTVDYTKTYNRRAAGTYSTDAAAYRFTVGDETYSLLDVKDNKDSKYFVIGATEFQHKNQFNENIDNDNYFRMPTSEEEAALRAAADGKADPVEAAYPSWGLNGEFFKNGWAHSGINNVKLTVSDSIRDYIDWNHVWTSEAAPDAFVSNNMYTYTAGITYPSAGEVIAYSDRFLEADKLTAFATRTMVNKEGEKRYIGFFSTRARKTETVDDDDTDAPHLYDYGLPCGGDVRPCFWLNDQFFANVAVDLATAGAAVKQEIKKMEPYALSKIYSAADLKTYLGFSDADLEKKFFTETINVSHDSVPSVSTTKKYAYKNDLDDYRFKVGNETFALLDAKNNSSSKYLVTTKDYYVSKQFSETNITNYFSMPTDEEIAYWVAQDAQNDYDQVASHFPSWAVNGNYFVQRWGFTANDNVPVRIADDVREYIDWNHVWECEPAPEAKAANMVDGEEVLTDMPNDKYSFKAGIAIPSMSEIYAYGDKFLYNEGQAIATRTIMKGDSSKRAVGMVNTTGADGCWFTWRWNIPAGLKIHPFFWVNDQFFANIAVDLETAGAAVKQEIKKVEISKLLELYSADEIKNVLGLDLPEDTVALYNVKVGTRSGNDPAYGETLIPKYDFLSGSGFSIAKTEVTWKKVDGDVETTIGTGDKYIVTEADAATGTEKIYYDIKVTSAAGASVTATSKKSKIPSLGVEPVNGRTIITGVKSTTDSADVFTIDGKSFTMLDSFDNDESTFFVAANDDYGTYKVTDNYMNPDDDSNYIYYTNTSLRNNGGSNGAKLPANIIKYIDDDHIWLTEGAPDSGAAIFNSKLDVTNYTFKAGIVPLSASELKRYKDVISSTFGADNSLNIFFTRTAQANATSEETKYLLTAKNGCNESVTDQDMWLPPWNLPSSTNIRVGFYLSKEFFQKVEVDFDNIGENILKAMQSIYSIEDLSDLYDEEYLESYGFAHKAQLNVTYSAYGDTSTILEVLNGATSLQANVTLTTAKAGIDANAILAIYDENDKLIKVTMKPITSDTTTATAVVGFESLQDMEIGNYAMLMVWDGMTPVTKADVFSSDDSLNMASEVKFIASDNTGNNFF